MTTARRILGKNILAAAGFVLLPILAALERHSPTSQPSRKHRLDYRPTPKATLSTKLASPAMRKSIAAIRVLRWPEPVAWPSRNSSQASYHRSCGVHYRVYSENGSAWLSFERPGDPEVRGTRRLLYFIGSGRRGRTYLFAVDGFVF
jgi:hypothetical protein